MEGVILEKNFYQLFDEGKLPHQEDIEKFASYSKSSPVCHGKGFNKNRLKPKMVQQGWEE